MFLAANLTKLVHGRMLLPIAVIAFSVMTTWQRKDVRSSPERARRRRDRCASSSTARRLSAAAAASPARRCSSTAADRSVGDVHRQAQPRAPRTRGNPGARHFAGAARTGLQADGSRCLGLAKDGIFHVTAHFGNMETPNVPGALRLLDQPGIKGLIAIDDASYFLSKLER